MTAAPLPMPKLVEKKETAPGDLVRSIHSGDRGAEQEFVRRFSPGLRFLLRTKTRDDELAEDLLQDTLIVLLTHLRKDGLGEPDKLKNYAYQTARNLYIGYVRKQQRRRTDAATDLVELARDETPAPMARLADTQRAALTRELISELKQQRDRDILRLFYLEDRDKPAVCDELGIPPKRFDGVVSRARLRFRQLVNRETAGKALKDLGSGE